MVEGAPLLRAYMGKTRIEGSNPSLSANESAASVLSLPQQRELRMFKGLQLFRLKISGDSRTENGALGARQCHFLWARVRQCGF